MATLGKDQLCEYTYNGQECFDKACELVREGTPISHILMDYMMPRLNGIQCAKRIRDFIDDWNTQHGEEYEEPVFVFITAFKTDAFKKNMDDLGFNICFEKPIQIASLKALLD
jgi:CheY-like chemotaxis protein